MKNELSTLVGAIFTIATSLGVAFTFGQVKKVNDAAKSCARFTWKSFKKTNVRRVLETGGSSMATIITVFARVVTLGKIETINISGVSWAKHTWKTIVKTVKTAAETLYDGRFSILAPTYAIGIEAVSISKNYYSGNIAACIAGIEGLLRYFTVIKGGVFGFSVFGPAGALVGGILTGSGFDIIATKFDSFVYQEYRPYGLVAAWNAVRERKSADNVVEGCVCGLIAFVIDALNGYDEGKTSSSAFNAASKETFIDLKNSVLRLKPSPTSIMSRTSKIKLSSRSSTAIRKRGIATTARNNTLRRLWDFLKSLASCPEIGEGENDHDSNDNDGTSTDSESLRLSSESNTATIKIKTTSTSTKRIITEKRSLVPPAASKKTSGQTSTNNTATGDNSVNGRSLKPSLALKKSSGKNFSADTATGCTSTNSRSSLSTFTSNTASVQHSTVNAATDGTYISRRSSTPCSASNKASGKGGSTDIDTGGTSNNWKTAEAFSGSCTLPEAIVTASTDTGGTSTRLWNFLTSLVSSQKIGESYDNENGTFTDPEISRLSSASNNILDIRSKARKATWCTSSKSSQSFQINDNYEDKDDEEENRQEEEDKEKKQEKEEDEEEEQEEEEKEGEEEIEEEAEEEQKEDEIKQRIWKESSRQCNYCQQIHNRTDIRVIFAIKHSIWQEWYGLCEY